MAVMVRVALASSARAGGLAWWTARITPTTGHARPVWLTALTTAARTESAHEVADEHLSAGLSTPRGDRLRPYADVLHDDLRTDPEHGLPCRLDEALRRAADALWRYPGCAVAAIGADDGLAVLTRTGECLRLPCGGGPGRRPAVIGSLVHAWIAAGRAASELLTLVSVQDGRARERASIRPANRSASSAPSSW